MKSLILFSLFSAALSSCPSGWVKFEDKCYRIEHSTKRTWQDARTQCLNMKGNLVRIYSDRENNFVKNELRKLHPGNSYLEQFWTAGNDLQTETVFVWDGMNDSINEYTDWAPHEPNQNGGNEDCIAFFPGEDYHWNDERCSNKENYICEQLDPAIIAG